MSRESEKKDGGMNRRNFLKLAGYSAIGGAAALAAPNTLKAAAPSGVDLKSGARRGNFWKKVRKSFVLDKKKVYMNIGTTGSMPKDVLKNYKDYNYLVAKDPWEMGGEWGDWPHTSELTSYIAPHFGADPDELILSRNTTDGMCTIIGGLALNPGDEILTTHHEHVAGVSPMTIVRDRFGVVINEVEIPV
ncbi:MAG: aminotransferase class V-fold PLP-dependent enzyme, partial [Desulfobacterales bacterium]|nr:aminotransferase class V-fold PLP-dependent enzyme [Desulfobacterales bacterium]